MVTWNINQQTEPNKRTWNKPFINKWIELAEDEVTYLKFQGLYIWEPDHAVANDMKGFADCILS